MTKTKTEEKTIIIFTQYGKQTRTLEDLETLKRDDPDFGVLTLESAKTLTHGEIVYHRTQTNSDQSPQRWKINGRVKLWKRSPDRIQIPIKHGLYSYDYITESDLFLVSRSEIFSSLDSETLTLLNMSD